tara:strand:- start:495 stop:770 length:276 start_codon:yes stop_codon:yes gene_type:complete
MARILTLTNEQFDDLYDVLEETIINIRENIEDTDLELNDYEIYKVWQQMNSNKNEPKVTISDDDYADKVDTLVGNMVASDDNEFTHDSEGC